jgi:hypothetical protein
MYVKIPYKWSEGLERLPQSDQTNIRRISELLLCTSKKAF